MVVCAGENLSRVGHHAAPMQFKGARCVDVHRDTKHFMICQVIHRSIEETCKSRRGQLAHDREKQLKNCWPFNLVPIVQPHVLGKRHIQPSKPEHLASVLIHCLDRLKVPLYARDVPTSREAAR